MGDIQNSYNDYCQLYNRDIAMYSNKYVKLICGLNLRQIFAKNRTSMFTFFTSKLKEGLSVMCPAVQKHSL